MVRLLSFLLIFSLRSTKVTASRYEEDAFCFVNQFQTLEETSQFMMAVTENLSFEVRQTIEFSAGMMIRHDESTPKPLPSCDEKGCVLLFLHIPKTGKFGTDCATRTDCTSRYIRRPTLTTYCMMWKNRGHLSLQVI
jgi:hypothetical protein